MCLKPYASQALYSWRLTGVSYLLLISSVLLCLSQLLAAGNISTSRERDTACMRHHIAY